ncbi:hypothetical protein Anapl_04810 [Anas platyrhynchos]|uniref:Uncharacterized protein n=1 Tax=Anas platyrhynchos TaxID=8839 RepID=R0L1Q8_ANAPL|nr:hypothetical protein Anapl_04810 [Anas platyrhynchos]
MAQRAALTIKQLARDLCVLHHLCFTRGCSATASVSTSQLTQVSRTTLLMETHPSFSTQKEPIVSSFPLPAPGLAVFMEGRGMTPPYQHPYTTLRALKDKNLLPPNASAARSGDFPHNNTGHNTLLETCSRRAGGKQPCVYLIVPVTVSLGRPRNEVREPGADLYTDDHNQIFMQQEETFPLPVERSRGSASRLPAQSTDANEFMLKSERTKEESKQTNESNRQLAETAGNVISLSRVWQSNFSWPKVKESQAAAPQPLFAVLSLQPPPAAPRGLFWSLLNGSLGKLPQAPKQAGTPHLSVVDSWTHSIPPSPPTAPVPLRTQCSRLAAACQPHSRLTHPVPLQSP